MLRDILSGKSSIDPSQLAGAAGLPSDPASISALMNQLQGALRGGGDGSINWDAALNQGQERAAQSQLDVTSAERAALDQAFHIASLWLDEVISVAELTTPPRLMTRKEWVSATMPLWTQLAEPVATSISDSLTRVLTDQAPEELKGMMAGAGQVMRSIGGTLFAMQLGQVVGQLSSEVVSGGDVGIPLLSDQQAALLPQNVAAFGEGLDVPADQVQIYLAVREIAHARLFRHSRWLRLHLISSITDFARGIHIDSSRLEQLADGFDPANPEELRAAMVDGSLIPPKSEAQLAALSRLETMLALIEGWVDVVTLEATSRLPRADAIAETVKRRRASGGPAESAFATLVGLELRPRRLREAAALWQAVTDAVGNEKRDELWAHPDLLPSSADLDDPQALVARLTSSAAGVEPVLDEVDQALEDLLRDDDTERPHEA
ncbi:zinc-dependent metalloprotease [Cryobacterium sp. Hz7]|uniref:Zinc-dependent metalloprotease n=2 Tax=Microbacteriaceae TaxID=85023 RepID=A0ABY2JM29_9MICO|nr:MULTISPECIES: zinc-dependent metalloprotease [Cryobacterium]TFB57390.1 zinc-dependent metalloprotease [Cryobacterium sp. Sr3]TFB64662.1 zinc-dependent metalloprotease [Cryobacterium sp. Hz7]TFC35054.1 zinc-dependent metalloprotease [Cryobacterium sp. TMT2-14]TFD06934.1 zinc-dependent metalloprotease [Cryobacterium sandaracinum]